MTARLPRRAAALALVLGSALMLQGCLVGAVVGGTAAVVGGTAKAAGSVVGAGVDAVTTSDEETRLRREREQREWEREQRRCEQHGAGGIHRRQRRDDDERERPHQVFQGRLAFLTGFRRRRRVSNRRYF